MLENLEALLATRGLQARLDTVSTSGDFNTSSSSFIERSCEAIYFSFAEDRSREVAFHGFLDTPYSPSYQIFSTSCFPSIERVTFHQSLQGFLESICESSETVVFAASIGKSSDRDQYFRKLQNIESGLVAIGVVPEKLSDRFAYLIPTVPTVIEPLWIATPWMDRTGAFYASKVPMGQLNVTEKTRSLARAADSEWISVQFVSFLFSFKKAGKKLHQILLPEFSTQDLPIKLPKMTTALPEKIVWVGRNRPILSTLAREIGSPWSERSFFCDISDIEVFFSFLHHEVQSETATSSLIILVSETGEKMSAAWELR